MPQHDWPRVSTSPRAMRTCPRVHGSGNVKVSRGHGTGFERRNWRSATAPGGPAAWAAGRTSRLRAPPPPLNHSGGNVHSPNGAHVHPCVPRRTWPLHPLRHGWHSRAPCRFVEDPRQGARQRARSAPARPPRLPQRVLPCSGLCLTPGARSWRLPTSRERQARVSRAGRLGRVLAYAPTAIPPADSACAAPALHRAVSVSARAVQDINARVGDTVPESRRVLNGKSLRGCEQFVEDRERLWMALEKEAETPGLGVRFSGFSARRIERMYEIRALTGLNVYPTCGPGTNESV